MNCRPWMWVVCGLALPVSVGLSSGCKDADSPTSPSEGGTDGGEDGGRDSGPFDAGPGLDGGLDARIADASEDGDLLDGSPLDAAAADEGGDDGGPEADASPDGGGADAGSFGCDGHAYLICEDFEDTDVDGIPQGWTAFGSPVAVAADQAYGGHHSLRMGAVSNGPRQIQIDADALGAAHWGRIFYRVQTPVPDAFVHSTLVALTGVGPNIGAAEYRVVDTVKAAVDAPGIESRYLFIYNVQPFGSAEFGRDTGFLWEFEAQWHCAEWHIDSADQSYALYYDGDEVLSFTNGAGNYTESEIPTSFDQLRIGWNNYQEAPPGFTAWIDEVALDDSRIGCDL